LSSAGVTGGTLIIVGEDYGEGASIIQERTHAFAMKSQVWLLDPRPNLPTIVRMVEHGFALSEASNSPVMLELRIRACHVHGSFACKDNRAPEISRLSDGRAKRRSCPLLPAALDLFSGTQQDRHALAGGGGLLSRSTGSTR
jgi:TPP-dependent indolepyruvate ferredoxin oxidoreductase alpha subunit